MLSRIKNGVRRFIGQSLCAVLDADHVDDLMRECLRSTMQEAAEVAAHDAKVDEDAVIEAIVGQYHINDDEVLERLVDGYSLDDSDIAERIAENMDMDAVVDAVKDEIDSDDIAERVEESLQREVRQEVVEGLLEDGQLTANITEEAVKELYDGKHLAVLAGYVADILEQRTLARQQAVEALRTAAAEVMQTAREEAR